MSRLLVALSGVVLAFAAATPASADSVFFSSHPTISVDASALAVADFDGDGVDDIAAADPIGRRIAVMRPTAMHGWNDDTLTDIANSPFAVGGSPSRIAAGDLDRDGRPDIVAPRSAGAGVDILLNTGAGFTSPPQSPVAAGAQPYAAAIGDFDGDAEADIVVSNPSAGTVWLLLGDGAGGFAAAVPTSMAAVELIAADVNGDGNLDVVTNQPATNSVGVMLGDGTGAFTTASYPTGPNPRSIVVADFDNDGRPDIATARDGAPAAVTILRNDGAGAFAQTLATVAVADGPVSAATADFDGDGNADLALGHPYSFSATILLGDGAGHFTSMDEYVGYGPSHMVVADLDHDGRPDIVTTHHATDSVAVLLNRAVASAYVDPPAAQDLGRVTIGTTGTERTLTVTSTGNAALRVAGVSVSGAGFHIAHETCSNRIVVAPCTVRVTFAPVFAGAHAGTLSIPTNGNGGTYTVSLSGIGTPAAPPTPTPGAGSDAPPDAMPPATPTPPPTAPVPPPGPATTTSTCASRRAMSITIPRRLRGQKVTIAINGRFVRQLRHAGKSVRVSLSGQAKGIYHVVLSAKPGNDIRTYRTCAAKAK